LVEYALLLALIAVVAAASLRAVGPAARDAFQRAVLTIGDGDITFDTPVPSGTPEASQTPGTTTPEATASPGPTTTTTPGATATPAPTATPVPPTPTPGGHLVTDSCSAILTLTRPGLYKAICQLQYSFAELESGKIYISPDLPDGMSLIVNLPAGSYTFHGALRNGQPPVSGPLPLSKGDLEALAGGTIILTASYLPLDGGYQGIGWKGSVTISVTGLPEIGGGDIIIPGPGPIVPKPPIVLD
jgi:hypothetical protein